MSGASAFLFIKIKDPTLYVFLGLVLFFLCLVVHEAGHAITMTRRGVEIEEAGIGLPLSKKVRITLHTRFLPFPLVLTPFLLGAYVKPTEKGEERIKTLPYKDQAAISGAGVIANVIFGAVLLVIVGFLSLTIPGHDTVRSWTLILVSVAIGVVFALFGRFISCIIPILGIAALVYVVYSIVISFDSIGGPIAVYKIAISGKSWVDVLAIAAAISLSLALTNVLPFEPLDGGRVVSSLLLRFKLQRLQTGFMTSTALLFVVFILFLVGKDIVGLF